MTAKLSDTQLVILSTACGRNDRAVFPITASLKVGALNKVLQSLLAKGYIEEVAAEAGTTVWRDEDEGPLTLRATHAAAVALGIEPDPEAPGPAETAQVSEAPNEEATPPEAATEPAGGRENAEGADVPPQTSSAPTEPAAGEEGPKVRAGTKQALLIEMLRRPEGTTIEQVIAATGWQAHTVRGAMAGALKKKLGFHVTSEKVEDRGRVYRISERTVPSTDGVAESA